jgi:hypothetical protein
MSEMLVLFLNNLATKAVSELAFPTPAKETKTNILLLELVGVIDTVNPESTNVEVEKDV